MKFRRFNFLRFHYCSLRVLQSRKFDTARIITYESCFIFTSFEVLLLWFWNIFNKICTFLILLASFILFFFSFEIISINLDSFLLNSLCLNWNVLFFWIWILYFSVIMFDWELIVQTLAINIDFIHNIIVFPIIITLFILLVLIIINFEVDFILINWVSYSYLLRRNKLIVKSIIFIFLWINIWFLESWYNFIYSSSRRCIFD